MADPSLYFKHFYISWSVHFVYLRVICIILLVFVHFQVFHIILLICSISFSSRSISWWKYYATNQSHQRSWLCFKLNLNCSGEFKSIMDNQTGGLVINSVSLANLNSSLFSEFKNTIDSIRINEVALFS